MILLLCDTFSNVYCSRAPDELSWNVAVKLQWRQQLNWDYGSGIKFQLCTSEDQIIYPFGMKSFVCEKSVFTI